MSGRVFYCPDLRPTVLTSFRPAPIRVTGSLFPLPDQPLGTSEGFGAALDLPQRPGLVQRAEQPAQLRTRLQSELAHEVVARVGARAREGVVEGPQIGQQLPGM